MAGLLVSFLFWLIQLRMRAGIILTSVAIG
jgi:xanthosine utilization system XapX-like protein